jgi:hypothetical protein
VDAPLFCPTAPAAKAGARAVSAEHDHIATGHAPQFAGRGRSSACHPCPAARLRSVEWAGPRVPTRGAFLAHVRPGSVPSIVPAAGIGIHQCDHQDDGQHHQEHPEVFRTHQRVSSEAGMSARCSGMVITRCTGKTASLSFGKAFTAKACTTCVNDRGCGHNRDWVWGCRPACQPPARHWHHPGGWDRWIGCLFQQRTRPLTQPLPLKQIHADDRFFNTLHGMRSFFPGPFPSLPHRREAVVLVPVSARASASPLPEAAWPSPSPAVQWALARSFNSSMLSGRFHGSSLSFKQLVTGA